MSAADKIRARIAELKGIRDRYLSYQQDRVSERDHHGAWDVAINLSETECEISGLEFALDAVRRLPAGADEEPRAEVSAGGGQTTSEATYTSYARAKKPRP